MSTSSCACWMAVLAVSLPASLAAQSRCPRAQYLPQLTIDDIRDPAVPVIDGWQVFWRDVPLSDAQVAQLAGHDPLIDRTRAEIDGRATWVYAGLLTAALGTALSSVGWVLLGENKLPQTATLPMALGGLVLSGGGILVVTQSIQRPLEPHLAPTPVHRLTREEARQLVAAVNARLYEEICEAAGEVDATGGAAGATP